MCGDFYMPIQDGKYVTPAWKDESAPPIDATELAAIGNSIMQDQANIDNLQTDNTQNQSNISQLLEWKTTAEPLVNGALQTTGGTMTGALILNGSPSKNLQAATKQYVDNVSNRVDNLEWNYIGSSSNTFKNTSTGEISKSFSVTIPRNVANQYTEYKRVINFSLSCRGSSSGTSDIYINGIGLKTSIQCQVGANTSINTSFEIVSIGDDAIPHLSNDGNFVSQMSYGTTSTSSITINFSRGTGNGTFVCSINFEVNNRDLSSNNTNVTVYLYGR